MKLINELKKEKDGMTFEELNHSTAHLLAAAILEMYPDTKIGIGPVIEEGFYYDFSFTNPISEKDFPKIEKAMKRIASGNHEIKYAETSKKEALSFFADQKYKVELINDLPIGNKITTYTLNKFCDLCKGPHVKSTKFLQNFKLLSVAGSYWRGDSKKDQLTRIYGTSWFSKEDLADYLNILQERKERDHRIIGKDLELFMFDKLGGSGLPFWLPKGQIIKNQIQNYIREEEVRFGFQEVSTPIMGDVELYKTSGHWGHYQKNMFPIMEMDHEELVLRPMACPHHCLIYKNKPKSYRDLPLRLAESVIQHRYEASGALIGLERVRGMTLTDAHIFVREDQIESEIKNMYYFVKKVLNTFNIDINYISLSLRDKNNKEDFYPDDNLWNNAENKVRKVLEEIGIEFKEMPGDAAFYGPKIDIQVKTVLGHDITMSTIQLDFVQPMKFELEYKNSSGGYDRPVMIHRGLVGTYERFLASLLEQTKGALPLWLSPVQVQIIPLIYEKHISFAEEIKNKLLQLNVRCSLDTSEERVSYKIRQSQLQKIPYTIVIGDEEIQNNQLNVREFGKMDQNVEQIDSFINKIIKKIKERN